MNAAKTDSDASDTTHNSQHSAPQVTFPDVTRDEVFRIETPRLWLRWPKISDAEEIASFAGLPEVAEMTASWPVGVSADEVARRIEDARRWNSRGERLLMVIVAKSAPRKVIGQIGLDSEDDATLGLGYHLAPEFWGQGLMSEAVSSLVTLAFWLTGAAAVKADIRIINAASRRVLQKTGFVATGTEVAQCGMRGQVEKENFRLQRGARAALRIV